MQRQMRRLLAQRDASVLDPDAIAEKSAAIQGLPALEFLLWNAKHPLRASETEAQKYRCALAVAISGNLSQLARELARGRVGASGLSCSWKRRSVISLGRSLP